MKCKCCGAAFPMDYIYPKCGYCGADLLKRKSATNKTVNIPAPKALPSGNYRGQVTVNGKRISVTAESVEAFYKAAEKKIAEINAGIEAEKTAAVNITLTKAIDDYIASKNAVLSPESIRQYRVIQRNRFQSLMHVKVSDITEKAVQAAINSEAKTVTPKTVKCSWLFIQTVINTVEKKDFKVTLPQMVKHEKAFLDADQIKVFCDALKNQDVEIPALLALSSLRRSELLALTWENVDMVNRQIKVDGAMVYDENNNLVYKKENKNITSKRTVPIMMDQLFEALDAIPECSRHGRVVHMAGNVIGRHINAICEKKALPVVGIHGLRHSFASLAIVDLKMPEPVVMKIGGWSDNATMRKVYTHAADSEMLKYQNQMAAYYNKAVNA